MNTLILKEELKAPKEKLKKILRWAYGLLFLCSLFGGFIVVLSNFTWKTLLLALGIIAVGPFASILCFVCSFGILLSPFILIKLLTLKELLFQEDNGNLLIKNRKKTIVDTPVSDVVSYRFGSVNFYTGSYASTPILEGNKLGDYMHIIVYKNGKEKKIELNLQFLSDEDHIRLHQFFSDVFGCSKTN